MLPNVVSPFIVDMNVPPSTSQSVQSGSALGSGSETQSSREISPLVFNRQPSSSPVLLQPVPLAQTSMTPGENPALQQAAAPNPAGSIQIPILVPRRVIPPLAPALPSIGRGAMAGAAYHRAPQDLQLLPTGPAPGREAAVSGDQRQAQPHKKRPHEGSPEQQAKRRRLNSKRGNLSTLEHLVALGPQLDACAAGFDEAFERARQTRSLNDPESCRLAISALRAQLEKSFGLACEYFVQHQSSHGNQIKQLAIFLYDHARPIWATMLRRAFINALAFRKPQGSRVSSLWFQANPHTFKSTQATGQCVADEGVKGMSLGSKGIMPTEQDFAPVLIMASILIIRTKKLAEKTTGAGRPYDGRANLRKVLQVLFDKLNESCAAFPGQEDVWRRNLHAAMDEPLYGIKSLDDFLRPQGAGLQWPGAQLDLKHASFQERPKSKYKQKIEAARARNMATGTGAHAGGPVTSAALPTTTTTTTAWTTTTTTTTTTTSLTTRATTAATATTTTSAADPFATELGAASTPAFDWSFLNRWTEDSLADLYPPFGFEETLDQ